MSEFFKPEDFASWWNEKNMQHECSAEKAAAVANRILAERGVRVYGSFDNAYNEAIGAWGDKASDDTHQALLIAVEPLRKDSAEGLLREIVNMWKQDVLHRDDLEARARALLEREGG